MTLSSKKIIELKEAMNSSTEEMALLFGVPNEQWLEWESGVSEPSIKQLIKIVFFIVTSGRVFINSTPPEELKHKLTKAKHFNEKLAESAMGADSTLHECIDDELTQVIKSLK